MTRKDFVLIANAINHARLTVNATELPRNRAAAQAALDTLVVELCGDLTSTNPNFDAARFRAACNGGN